MKLIKTVMYYVFYLAFIIVASYSLGVALAHAEECGPATIEYPIKDLQIDVKEILKKLLEPVIIKS